MKSSFSIPCAALALLAITAPSTRADASGFATARFGGEHGTPVSTNPTAIYYNPAAIGESEGTDIFLDVGIALRHASYAHQQAVDPATGKPNPATTGDTAQPADAKGANYGQNSLFNVVAAPMIGATTKIGDLALGLGFYVPFGGQEKWNKNDAFQNSKYPGPYDGVQRWYTIEGKILSYYWTAAVAYDIKQIGLSIGASANLIRSQVDTIRARTVAGDNDLTNEGRSYLSVAGWQGSFGVGAMLQAIPKTLWIGLSYQARPNVAGGMTLHGNLKQNLSGAQTDEPVDFAQDLPDILRGGVRFKPRDDIELRLFGDYTRWSAMKNQCIVSADNHCTLNADGSKPADSKVIQNLPRNWHDSFGIRAGGSLWLKPELELFTGLGFDSSAVPASTMDPAGADHDFNTVSAALGARYQFIKNLAGALSYTHFFMFSRDTAGENENFRSYPSPSKGPDAGGQYKEWIGLINADIEVMF